MATTMQKSAKDSLEAIRGEIRDLRDERAELRRRRDSMAEAAVDKDGNFPTMNSPEFQKLERATADLRQVEDKIVARQAEENRLLGVLGGDVTPPGAEAADTPNPLLAEDGAWLQAVLLGAADQVPGAREKMQAGGFGMTGGALAAALDTTEAGTVTTSEAVVEAFRPRSVLGLAGVPTMRIASTQGKVPWVKERPTAGWSKEGEAFAKGAPTVEMVDVEPKRCGLVSPLSIEVYEDISPSALAAVQRAILTAVAIKADAGLIAGKGEGAEPKGLLKQTGIATAEGKLADGLSAFVAGAAELIANEATPKACVVNAENAKALGEVVEFGSGEEGESTSRKPLVGIAKQFTVDALPETTFYVSSGIEKGKALMLDPTAAAVVLRRTADLSIDPYYNFDDGEIALRAFLRADVLVQPEGVCAITLK